MAENAMKEVQNAMGRSRKIRHRAKLVTETKPPINAKLCGFPSVECLSRKDLRERAKRGKRRHEQHLMEFRREAREEPPRKALARSATEQAAIDLFSDAIAARIVAEMHGALVETTLIPKGSKNGTRAKVSPRQAIKLSSFASLAECLRSQGEAESECRQF